MDRTVVWLLGMLLCIVFVVWSFACLALDLLFQETTGTVIAVSPQQWESQSDTGYIISYFFSLDGEENYMGYSRLRGKSLMEPDETKVAVLYLTALPIFTLLKSDYQSISSFRNMMGVALSIYIVLLIGKYRNIDSQRRIMS